MSDSSTKISAGVLSSPQGSSSKVPASSTDKKPKQKIKNTPKVVASYYANWSIFARDYSLDRIPGSDLTHVLYAFMAPGEDGTVKTLDGWADLEWGPQDQDSKTVEGCLRRMAQMKKKHQHLKFLISVGGWNHSHRFSQIAADPQKRLNFATSVADLVSGWGFDGVDIDWEYPGSAGASNNFSKDDPDNFILLLRDVRTQLKQNAKLDGATPYLLTAALPAAKDKAKLLDIQDLGKELDYLFLMTYDKNGMGWSTVSDHQSDCRWIRDAVNFYVSNGVPARKICIGSPLYGRVFTKSGGLKKGFEKTWDREDGQWETHIWDYKSLPRPGAQVYWDDAEDASYSYDDKKKEFITFDTPLAVKTKCTIVKQKNLGGIFFWETSADKVGAESLIRKAADDLGKLEMSRNHLRYPRSPWSNIQTM
jgi:chitinase